jgi:hypothetical protein
MFSCPVPSILIISQLYQTSSAGPILEDDRFIIQNNVYVEVS